MPLRQMSLGRMPLLCGCVALRLYCAGVRVVGGVLGGRKLEIPKAGTRAIRPTSDRVREAVFNMLTSLRTMEAAIVVDLFAGTGALGIEALSRGAAQATFVDSDALACRTIKANLAALGIHDRATVTRTDVAGFLARHDGPVDIVFADPPYRFDGWRNLLDEIHAEVLVCESNREIKPETGAAWQTYRARPYGTPVITILTRRITG